MSIETYEQLEEAEQRPFNKEYFFRMLGYLRRYRRELGLTALAVVAAAGVAERIREEGQHGLEHAWIDRRGRVAIHVDRSLQVRPLWR